MDNKLFWYANMGGAVLGWIFIFYGLFNPLPSVMARIAWIVVLLAWGIGHPLELTKSLPIAKDANVPVSTAVWKTFIFGLTWWVPLQKGVFTK